MIRQKHTSMDGIIAAPGKGTPPAPLRHIARRTQAGAPAPGFAGPGHVAVEVFSSDALVLTDPFVMLMDDRLDFRPGQAVGEAHPHAGLETVTLVLEGALDDAAEGLLHAGDLAWMTAGRGIVHNEDVKATGYARILQLWIALPGRERQNPPDLQIVPLHSLPIRREPGMEARLYSGRTGDLVSPTRNRVPTTIVDFLLDADVAAGQSLPGAYAGFLYVIGGSIEVQGGVLQTGDVGWLDSHPQEDTILSLRAGAEGARVLLYASEPLHEPIVHYGPFVAGSRHELAGYYQQYVAGLFDKISEVAARLAER